MRYHFQQGPPHRPVLPRHNFPGLPKPEGRTCRCQRGQTNRLRRCPSSRTGLGRRCRTWHGSHQPRRRHEWYCHRIHRHRCPSTGSARVGRRQGRCRLGCLPNHRHRCHSTGSLQVERRRECWRRQGNHPASRHHGLRSMSHCPSCHRNRRRRSPSIELARQGSRRECQPSRHHRCLRNRRFRLGHCFPVCQGSRPYSVRAHHLRSRRRHGRRIAEDRRGRRLRCLPPRLGLSQDNLGLSHHASLGRRRADIGLA